MAFDKSLIQEKSSDESSESEIEELDLEKGSKSDRVSKVGSLAERRAGGVQNYLTQFRPLSMSFNSFMEKSEIKLSSDSDSDSEDLETLNLSKEANVSRLSKVGSFAEKRSSGVRIF